MTLCWMALFLFVSPGTVGAQFWSAPTAVLLTASLLAVGSLVPLAKARSTILTLLRAALLLSVTTRVQLSPLTTALRCRARRAPRGRWWGRSQRTWRCGTAESQWRAPSVLRRQLPFCPQHWFADQAAEGYFLVVASSLCRAAWAAHHAGDRGVDRGEGVLRKFHRRVQLAAAACSTADTRAGVLSGIDNCSAVN